MYSDGGVFLWEELCFVFFLPFFGWLGFYFHKTGDWFVHKTSNTKHWLLQNFFYSSHHPWAVKRGRNKVQSWEMKKF